MYQRWQYSKILVKKNDLDYTEVMENMMEIFILDTDMMIKANNRWNNHFKDTSNEAKS